MQTTDQTHPWSLHSREDNRPNSPLRVCMAEKRQRCRPQTKLTFGVSIAEKKETEIQATDQTHPWSLHSREEREIHAIDQTHPWSLHGREESEMQTTDQTHPSSLRSREDHRPKSPLGVCIAEKSQRCRPQTKLTLGVFAWQRRDRDADHRPNSPLESA